MTNGCVSHTQGSQGFQGFPGANGEKGTRVCQIHFRLYFIFLKKRQTLDQYCISVAEEIPSCLS